MQIASVVFFILLGAGLLIRTFQDPHSLQYPLAYSQVLIAAVTLLFAIYLAELLMKRARAGSANGTISARLKRELQPLARPLAGLIACIVYLFAWTVIGYVPSTILFLVAMLLIGGERKPLVIGAVSLGVAFGIMTVFMDMLMIPLPGIPW